MDGQAEGAHARGDRREAPSGRGAGGARQGCGGGGALHRRDRADVRDELLRAEAFNSLREAQVLIEQWRQYYNTARPHSALGYRPPAPEVAMPMLPMPPPRTLGDGGVRKAAYRGGW